jgi:exodeoxyribonuclease V alpha subunit
MIDLPLMARLVDALPEQARLVLLGDRDQLASVEAGSVLGDITGHGRELRYGPEQARLLADAGAAPAGALPVADAVPPAADCVGLLRVSYRFGAGSGIGAAARAVNAGRGGEALEILTDPAHGDTAWLDAGGDALHPGCIERAVEAYAAYLAEADVAPALTAFEGFRVLAAVHRGPFGVEALNRVVAARLQARGLVAGEGDFHGKPVLITANDYEMGLYNGDVGLLWREGRGDLRAWFRVGDGGIRDVSVRRLPAHVPAWALTVHKSQGSEFDEVLLVLPPEPGPVLTRELVYTGLTRARRRVTVQGARGAFAQACARRVQRASGLAEKLGWPPD